MTNLAGCLAAAGTVTMWLRGGGVSVDAVEQTLRIRATRRDQ